MYNIFKPLSKNQQMFCSMSATVREIHNPLILILSPKCVFSALHMYKSSRKKVNRKVQEEPQAEAAANPWHQEEKKKVCIANKQCTISTKTSSLFPKQGDQNAKRTEETYRQSAGQDQTWSAS